MWLFIKLLPEVHLAGQPCYIGLTIKMVNELEKINKEAVITP
jgi:hypothetical protein